MLSIMKLNSVCVFSDGRVEAMGSIIPSLQSITQSCIICTMVYLQMVLRDLLDHKRSDCRYQIKDNLSRGLRFSDSDQAELSCSHHKASHPSLLRYWESSQTNLTHFYGEIFWF